MATQPFFSSHSAEPEAKEGNKEEPRQADSTEQRNADICSPASQALPLDTPDRQQYGLLGTVGLESAGGSNTSTCLQLSNKAASERQREVASVQLATPPGHIVTSLCHLEIPAASRLQHGTPLEGSNSRAAGAAAEQGARGKIMATPHAEGSGQLQQPEQIQTAPMLHNGRERSPHLQAEVAAPSLRLKFPAPSEHAEGSAEWSACQSANCRALAATLVQQLRELSPLQALPVEPLKTLSKAEVQSPAELLTQPV